MMSLELQSDDKFQDQRGDQWWVFVHRGIRFRGGPVTSGLISKITLTSKNLVPRALEYGEDEYIAYICAFVIDYCMDDLCDRWIVLFVLSLFISHPLFVLLFTPIILFCVVIYLYYPYYAPLIYMNVFSPPVCFCVVIYPYGTNT